MLTFFALNLRLKHTVLQALFSSTKQTYFIRQKRKVLLRTRPKGQRISFVDITLQRQNLSLYFFHYKFFGLRTQIFYSFSSK